MTRERLRGQRIEESSVSQLVEPLTRRETEMLQLAAKGLQNREIAEKLFVSNHTVKKHLYNVCQKLNVNNRRAAISRSPELGIIA